MITIVRKNKTIYLNGEELKLATMYDGRNCSGYTYINKAGETVLDERIEYNKPTPEEIERVTKELADLMHDDI